MPKPTDEKLIAYLDGELTEGERAEVASWLERDDALRERATRLTESATLLRAAFDEVLHEPLPERLVAAAHGETGKVVNLAQARRTRWKRLVGDRRSWIGMAAAAAVVALVGTGAGYWDDIFGHAAPGPSWLDNAAVYHSLYVNAGSDEKLAFDVPAGQKLPPNFHLPDLKPWGLDFQGVRYLIIEGRPAAQLFYTTDNKALGPLTVVVASTSKPDQAPNFAQHGNMNLLYWRHHGHAYALVGTANIGYLWNIHKDIAYQLDTI